MKNNKTAMQEFSEWLLAFEYELPLELQIKAKECLELEKDQIKEAYDFAMFNDINIYSYKSAEQYFNENYNQKDK